ncbi:hypothetical protein HY629_00775 [Candidatus Uhrbacteria bacterium]|nr:hypothetical protein [Candidatus Uhrbacteria bacterium]
MALPEGKRRLTDALNQDARREIIRDFDRLLFLCLHYGFPDAYDDVLAEIVKIPELRLQEYRSPTQYYLPRNLLAPYRALVTAFRTERSIADILGWDANAPEDRNAHHVSRAGELFRDLKDAVRPADSGYARIMAMRMTDAGGASAVRTTGAAPIPSLPVDEPHPVAPAATLDPPMIQATLVFTGDEQIRKWQELLEIAKRHGGVEAFLLHIVDVVKQRPKT